MQDIQIQRNKTLDKLFDSVANYKRLGRQLATAERDYKIALCSQISKLHITDGVAWTACATMAHGHTGKEWGDCGVATLRFRRDVLNSDWLSEYELMMAIKIKLKLLEGEAVAIRNGG